MTTPIFDTKGERTILEHIHEGMRVIDANNADLGKVDYVHLGEVNSEAAERGEQPATVTAPTDAAGTLMDSLQRVFGKDDIAPELRSRLLQSGFVYVDVAGLFSHNRYVLPDQITQVTNEGVVLKATRAELVKDK